MTTTEIIAHLRSLGSAINIEGQRRFGVTPQGEQFGVMTDHLRALAKAHRRQHPLALELWDTGIFEARQLAALIDDPSLVTREQMEDWVSGFDNWATCDNACMHLFRKTPHAFVCARAWTQRPEPFVKRAGFTLIATLSVHAKKEPDSTFEAFLPVIEAAAHDDRNFVKKAVNWALRQIGKRSPPLCLKAILCAKRIHSQNTTSARWIARDALRELEAHL